MARRPLLLPRRDGLLARRTTIEPAAGLPGTLSFNNEAKALREMLPSCLGTRDGKIHFRTRKIETFARWMVLRRLEKDYAIYNQQGTYLCE